MAESYSHKFGQIIGDLLEVAIQPFLAQYAQENDLFLDIKGVRPLRKKSKKLTWKDFYGNTHDLDFVLERGGSESTQGAPVAFIEAAWRRYTKHSRNKTQEIQGALLPLAKAYKTDHPFLGAILAGEFTHGSLTQLRSTGFSVLHFPYETVIEAFARFDIDASSHDRTSEAEFAEKVRQFYGLPDPSAVATALVEINRDDVDVFLNELADSINRRIENIYVLPLHGSSNTLTNVQDAIDFVTSYAESEEVHPFRKYEIIVRYHTGTEINGKCLTKKEALHFLMKFS